MTTYTAEQIAERAAHYEEAVKRATAAFGTINYDVEQHMAVVAMEALYAADPRHPALPAWYRKPAESAPGPIPSWGRPRGRRQPASIHGGFHGALTTGRKPGSR